MAKEKEFIKMRRSVSAPASIKTHSKWVEYVEKAEKVADIPAGKLADILAREYGGKDKQKGL